MFVVQAYRGKNDLWRYLLVVLTVVLGYILGQIPLILVSIQSGLNLGLSLSSVESMIQAQDFAGLGMGHNLVFFLMLLMFVFAMIVLYLGVRLIHQRPFLSIWTSRRKLDWSRIFWAFGVWFSMSLILEGGFYLMEPGNYTFQFQPLSFMGLLALSLFILPIQTSFEEVFVRGYLLQGIAYGARSRWAGLIVSAIIFGSLHLLNPEVAEFGLGLMMFYYITMGLFLGILGLGDEGLELSIGVHTATNIYGAVMVSFSGSALHTDALFHLNQVNAGSMALFSVGACVLFVFLADRKYRFNWAGVFGPYIPARWTRKYTGETERKPDIVSSEEEAGGKWLTRGLVRPSRFFKGATHPDFELSIYKEGGPADDSMVQMDAVTSREILTKAIEYSNSAAWRESDLVSLTLNDGSTHHLVLLQMMDEKSIDGWPLRKCHIFSVTPSYYERINKKMINRLKAYV